MTNATTPTPACPRCEGSGFSLRLGETNRPCSICDGTGTMEAAVKNATEGTTPTRPTGNEIRVKCAEAMGAKRYKRPWDNKVFLCMHLIHAKWDTTTDPITNIDSDIPEYAESCDAAMELVAALRKEGWSWVANSQRAEIVFMFYRRKHGVANGEEHEGRADTLPLAIALAFLATKGLEP